MTSKVYRWALSAWGIFGAAQPRVCFTILRGCSRSNLRRNAGHQRSMSAGAAEVDETQSKTGFGSRSPGRGSTLSRINVPCRRGSSSSARSCQGPRRVGLGVPTSGPWRRRCRRRRRRRPRSTGFGPQRLVRIQERHIPAGTPGGGARLPCTRGRRPVGCVPLADGRECKLVTGSDDHSPFVVIASVVAVPSARAVRSAFTVTMRGYGFPFEGLTDNRQGSPETSTPRHCTIFRDAVFTTASPRESGHPR